MTHKEVAAMVKSIGLPYAYYQFPEGTAQAPPFVVFFYASPDDVYADDKNYQRIETLNIEFYSSDKDFANEAVIEGILSNNGLTYYKEENHIESENLFQIAYEMEVMING